MGISVTGVVGVSQEDVFAWYGRPGAMARLVPPWLPLKVGAEAADLRKGTSQLVVAGVMRMTARHIANCYQPPRSFAEEIRPFGSNLARYRHSHIFRPAGDERTRVEDRVTTLVPRSLLREVLAYGQRQLAADLEAHAWATRSQRPPMTVAITGSSGTIGRALAAFLTSGGHRVVRLVRRPASARDERRWQPDSPAPGLLKGVDAVVHLAGTPIYGRFTEAHKQALVGSRVAPTRYLAEAAARASADGDGPSCFISASAVGYYGHDRADEVLTEQSHRGHGFLADLCEQWEGATQPASDGGLRVVRLRMGILQTPAGGMLRLLYPVFLAGMGGRLGTGEQWVPWVALDDVLDICLRALVDLAMSGPVNCVAPGVVTNREYTATLASVLRRPAVMTVPRWAPALALRPEGAREFALAGQRAEPAVLRAGEHSWRYPTLEQALRHSLGRWGPGPGQSWGSVGRTGDHRRGGDRDRGDKPALVL